MENQQISENGIEEYKEDLEKASKGNENRIVLNDGPVKASILTTILLKNSKDFVYIYSNNLNKVVTSNKEFISILESKLSDPKIEVKILLNEATNNKEIEKLFKKYAEYKKFNNQIVIVKDFTKIKQVFKDDMHFSVYDNKAYRLEYNTISYKAEANFNEPKMANGLKELFLYLFED